MSKQFIPHSTFDEIKNTRVNLPENPRVPQQMATLTYQEMFDNEVAYSAGINSPVDQRSLPSTSSPHESSPRQEPADLTPPPLSPLTITHLSSSSTSSPTSSPLASLPPELHLLIISHLDPLDSTCLSLTNTYFHALHRLLHGPGAIPLCTTPRRRCRGRACELHRANTNSNKLEKNCHHCNAPPSLCQLHMHLREWVPDRYEYCAVRGVFVVGLKAERGENGVVVPGEGEDRGLGKGEGGRGEVGYCYRCNPLRPERCGRHPVKEGSF